MGPGSPAAWLSPSLALPAALSNSLRHRGGECLPQFQPPGLCPQTWTSATACHHPVTAGAARTHQAASCACALLGIRLLPMEPAARVRDWEGHGEGDVGGRAEQQ